MAFTTGITNNTAHVTTEGTGGDLAAAVAIVSGAPWPDGGEGENDRVTLTIAKGGQTMVITQADFETTSVKLETWDEEPAA